MKAKLLILSSLLLAFTVSAANHTSQSFLVPDVRSVDLTNTMQLTNLASFGVYPTNVVGLEWTNSAGTKVRFDGTNSVNAYKNLCADVTLWSTTEGQFPAIYSANATGLGVTNSACGNIFIRLLGQSGANSAVTFTFVPLADGIHESTIAGDALSIAVTAIASTETTLITPVPAYKWPGVSKLRLKTAVNADTDATSKVTVLNVSYNGFMP